MSQSTGDHPGLELTYRPGEPFNVFENGAAIARLGVLNRSNDVRTGVRISVVAVEGPQTPLQVLPIALRTSIAQEDARAVANPGQIVLFDFFTKSRETGGGHFGLCAPLPGKLGLLIDGGYKITLRVATDEKSALDYPMVLTIGGASVSLAINACTTVDKSAVDVLPGFKRVSIDAAGAANLPQKPVAYSAA